jgi:YVTN family beta-propeller protein
MSLILIVSYELYAAPFIYVTTDSSPTDLEGGPTIYIIDVATNALVTTIDLGVDIQYNGIAITPDGKTLYVACTNDTVSVINVATNTPLSIAVSAQPRSIAISPNGQYAYVTCNDGTINRINIASGAVDVVISGLTNPADITIAPNGLTAYVSRYNGTTVTAVDLLLNELGGTVNVTSPFGLVVTPDNAYLYATSETFDEIVQINVTNRLAPALTGVTIPISAPSSPVGLALLTDSTGIYLYVTLISGSNVIPINISNPTSPIVGTAVSTGSGSQPWMIAITPDGTLAYVSDTGGPHTLTALNITNRMAPTQAATITQFGNNTTAGLAITPVPLIPSGSKTQNKFLLQTDFINILTWTPQIQSYAPIVAYNIYRDAALTQLIATVPASGPLQYSDHDRSPNTVYTYYIAGVDAFGNVYVPISISF